MTGQLLAHRFDRDGYVVVRSAVAAGGDPEAVAGDPGLRRLVSLVLRDDIGHHRVRVLGQAQLAAWGARPPGPDHDLVSPGSVTVVSRWAEQAASTVDINGPVAMASDEVLVVRDGTRFRPVAESRTRWLVVSYFPALRTTRFGWPRRISGEGDDDTDDD